MGNPARKFSKGRRDRRRAQTFKLSMPSVSECSHCHEVKLPHRVCNKCGFYDGKQVINVES